MDSSLLYGYMFGGGTLMAAVAAMAINFLSIEGSGKYIILGTFFAFAWIIHFGFLTWLQAEACSGVKSFRAIGLGSLLGSIFTAGCLAIPLHMDWARLAFSDTIFTHYAKLTPEVTAFASKFVSAMRQQGGGLEDEIPAEAPRTPTAPPAETLRKPTAPLAEAQQPRDILALQKLLNEKEYDKQTAKETIFAAPVWAFLAGACGIGFGNLVSGSQCS
jgi:hypothetical protein